MHLVFTKLMFSSSNNNKKMTEWLFGFFISKILCQCSTILIFIFVLFYYFWLSKSKFLAFQVYSEKLWHKFVVGVKNLPLGRQDGLLWPQPPRPHGQSRPAYSLPAGRPATGDKTKVIGQCRWSRPWQRKLRLLSPWNPLHSTRLRPLWEMTWFHNAHCWQPSLRPSYPLVHLGHSNWRQIRRIIGSSPNSQFLRTLESNLMAKLRPTKATWNTKKEG